MNSGKVALHLKTCLPENTDLFIRKFQVLLQMIAERSRFLALALLIEKVLG